jgi:hypothetical protein
MPVNTVRSSSPIISGIPAPEIYGARYQFEVGRIDAASNPTFVIQLKAIWNLSTRKEPCRSMAGPSLSFPARNRHS